MLDKTQKNQPLNENICYYEGIELHRKRQDYRDVIVHYDPIKDITTLLFHKERYRFEVNDALVNKLYLMPNPHVNDLLLNYQVLDNAFLGGELEMWEVPRPTRFSTLNALYTQTTVPLEDG